jgi:ADP-ribosylation factor GTPase-activating protein 2/3
LLKLSSEEHNANLIAEEAHKTSPEVVSLDKLISNLSTNAPPPLPSLPASVFTLSAAEGVAAASETKSGTNGTSTPTPSYVPVPKGILDVSAATPPPFGSTPPPEGGTPTPASTVTPTESVSSGTTVSNGIADVDTAADGGGYVTIKPTASKVLTKKPLAATKKPAARVMASSTTDVKLESFENMERRLTNEAKKEAAATKLQVATDSANSSASTGSSRLDDVYAASMAAPASPSKKPVTPKASYAVASPTTPSSTSRYGNLSSSSSSLSSSSSAAAMDTTAKSKYTNAKSISSDQFFGRDEQQAAENKAKLDRYAGSSSISSDMLNGNEDVRSGSGAGRYDDADGAEMVSALKDSVKGFFDDISRRLGKTLLIDDVCIMHDCHSW